MPSITGEPYYQDMPCGCCKTKAQHDEKITFENARSKALTSKVEGMYESFRKKGITDNELRQLRLAILDEYRDRVGL